ncbi:hypothetical protein [Sandaracinus amylolyticus]|uniref:Uncharacterized protein n=1 Tax=Sandaracinus amylolyticus TaxID=927083 RepID=A0A0F6W074_9BACT|nr:hypothetical protein [Sandaracinus amylolyticus]AKF04131.1 hypothetical protein DB32_001280 [Sandaracinus amylolyticus]
MNDVNFEVLEKGFGIALWRNVVIQMSLSDPNEARMRATRQAGRKLMTQTRGPIGAVIVVGPKCPVPDAVAREHAVGFLSDMRERARGVCLVFEGDGFLAAASRLAMVGMISAARFPFEYKIARYDSEADVFLRQHLDAWSAGELVSAINRLRVRIPVDS